MWYVAEMAPGTPDDEILQLAAERNALLLTHDRDFGEFVVRQGRATAGVLLIRLYQLSVDMRAELVSTTLREHSGELINNFSVLTPGDLRIARPAR